MYIEFASPLCWLYVINLGRNNENVYCICFRKHRYENSRKQLFHFNNQNANSLCTRHYLKVNFLSLSLLILLMDYLSGVRPISII